MYNNIKKDVIKYGLNKTIEECMLNIDLLLSIYNRRLIGYIKKGNKHLIELTGGLIVAYEFNNKIQEEIAKRLDEFSNSELILLLTNNKVNDSDRLSKMLAPSFQMLTAKQQAEITAASQEKQAAIQATGTVAASASQSSSVKDMSDNASTELLKGMSQLSNLLSAITVSVKEKTN